MSTVTAQIITAPDEFILAGPDALGLSVKVNAFRGGVAVFQSKLGEIIAKLPQGTAVGNGQHALLRPGDVPGTAILVLQASRRPKHVTAHLDDGLGPVIPGRYVSESKPKADPVSAHRAAADALFDTVIKVRGREDPFMAARALCLVPDLDGDRAAAMAMAFMLASLARGDAGTWLGAAKPAADDVWRTIAREASVDLPGMGRWKARQFPVLSGSGMTWALFALPEEPSGRVSRFILETPTEAYGMVQVKAFGTPESFEIVVNAETEPGQDAKAAIRAAAEAAGNAARAEITVKVFSDPRLSVDLSAARRVTLEA